MIGISARDHGTGVSWGNFLFLKSFGQPPTKRRSMSFHTVHWSHPHFSDQLSRLTTVWNCHCAEGFNRDCEIGSAQLRGEGGIPVGVF
jgi:hypothetical protein